MKIDRLETHDRYQHFTKQEFDIGECCNEVIKNRPEEFGNLPFYIFAHTRTHEDGISQRLIWQPRLIKPKAQTNSMLFKAFPPGDAIRVIWIIPKRELWGQYGKGLICENKTVSDSIEAFKSSKHMLEMPEKDDLDDNAANAIYRLIALNMKSRKNHGISKN